MNKENKKPIKLICIDLDGTLIDIYNKEKPNHIPEENIKSIQKAVANGIHVCFSTGRRKTNCQRFAKIIGIEDEYYICYNGAKICKGNETLYECPLEGEILQRFNETIRKHQMFCQYYVDDILHIDKIIDHVNTNPSNIGLDIVVMGEEVYNLPSTTKLSLCTYDKEEKEKWFEILNTVEGAETVNIAHSTPIYIEITAKDANKGNAVKFLANELGITLDQVMAIGDGDNDLPMLDVAGYPVVMGQARDELKKGRLVTESCSNAGVSVAIEKYCFGVE